MDKNIELYIKTGIDTDATTFPYERLELYDFEDINITSKIQDIRDISKIFTDYSREFSVPASRNNNKVFKHYYNWYIDNGFDARFKVDGILKIDGADYKKGKISLLDVSMRDNSPLSYKIVFYGETVSLKDIFGDDELKDLGVKASNTSIPTVLDKYKFEYDADFAKDGLRYGWVWDEVNQELRNPQNTVAVDFQNLCFPFISGKNYYFFDTDIESNSPTEGSTESRNLKYDATTANSEDNTPRGLNYLDLKPALRIELIIQSIEERYGLTFNRDGFLNTSNSDYYNLFMWLNREAGSIDEQLSESSKLYNLSDFTPTGSPTWSGDSDIDDITLTPLQGYELDITITPSAGSTTDEYLVRIPSIGSGVSYQSIQTGTQTLPTIDYKPDASNPYAPALGFGAYPLDIYIESLDGGFTEWSIDITLTKFTKSGGIWSSSAIYNFNALNLQTFPIGGAGVTTIASQMPKMKVMDFLTSLFKMFNLTTYFEEGEIYVQTLDSYYQSGQEFDITDYVDTSSGNVGRAKLFSEVNLEFEDPKTFAIVKSNEITGDEFGNERLSNLFASLELRDLLAFDGGSYDVKPKFERMMFERMNQQGTSTKTDICWGWSVSDEQNPVVTKPVLFYPETVSLGTATNPPYTIAFDENPQMEEGDYLVGWNKLNQTEINQYIKATNINEDTNNSIHFGSEFDEYSGTYNGNSLTFNYWTRYVLSIYDKRSRIVKSTAYLPSHLITSIELKDIVIINSIKYRINSIDINLNKGEVKLELFNDLGYYD